MLRASSDFESDQQALDDLPGRAPISRRKSALRRARIFLRLWPAPQRRALIASPAIPLRKFRPRSPSLFMWPILGLDGGPPPKVAPEGIGPPADQHPGQPFQNGRSGRLRAHPAHGIPRGEPAPIKLPGSPDKSAPQPHPGGHPAPIQPRFPHIGQSGPRRYGLVQHRIPPVEITPAWIYSPAPAECLLLCAGLGGGGKPVTFSPLLYQGWRESWVKGCVAGIRRGRRG